MSISDGILNTVSVVLKIPVRNSRNATGNDMPIISGVDESHCHVGLI
jgi:hypothetical protein